jgi:hypothetical protein
MWLGEDVKEKGRKGKGKNGRGKRVLCPSFYHKITKYTNYQFTP